MWYLFFISRVECLQPGPMKKYYGFSLFLFFLSVHLFQAKDALSQCNTACANLLQPYNADFSITGNPPPGFFSDAMFVTGPTGAGTYLLIEYRDYGPCGSTPQYDHTVGGPG